MIDLTSEINGATWLGLRVIVSQDSPRFTMDKRLAEIISHSKPEFVAEYNAWLRSFFGITNTVPDGTVYKLELCNSIVMNPRTAQALKEACK
jgi:hypothetical protein